MNRYSSAMLLALLPVPALADEVQELSQHIGKAVGAFEAVAQYHRQCDSLDPGGAIAHKDAVAAWAHDNSRADYERVMKALIEQLPELAKQLDPQRADLAARVAADLDRSPQQCANLAELLEDEQFDVEHSVRRLLSLSYDVGIDIPDVPDSTPAIKTLEDVEILRIATLSARLEAKMSEIGSEQGARVSSSLRQARSDHAEAWLEADGLQVIFGQVTTEDELREWRGDVQSTFNVDCRSFSDEAHEERMAASVGEDMVVVGMPRTVVDSPVGGSVVLDRCSLFNVGEVDRPFVEEDDEAGLMLRPLEFAEAYAGPNKGIRLDDVDRVLYASSFDNRLDGFGNGYVDRQEAIYVLLRDGSAYRHEWSFPFTDLAIERSRQREPGRWYSWAEQEDTVTLRGSEENGKEAVDLTTAQRLKPFPERSLDADYYYLQVGMGGTRQDRRFAFSADGAVSYSRSGFVAGNVGTSYIIVNGEDDPVVTARYRFEDFALILETTEGEERHFLAMPQSASLPLPDTLLIDGTAYWLDDD